MSGRHCAGELRPLPGWRYLSVFLLCFGYSLLISPMGRLAEGSYLTGWDHLWLCLWSSFCLFLQEQWIWVSLSTTRFLRRYQYPSYKRCLTSKGPLYFIYIKTWVSHQLKSDWGISYCRRARGQTTRHKEWKLSKRPEKIDSGDGRGQAR